MHRWRYLAFIEAVFAAYVSREEDISQDDVPAAICGRVGLNALALLAGIAKPDIKARLKANTDTAIRRGAFGSPTFFVGDNMYFGNDRLTLLRSAVRSAARSPRLPTRASTPAASAPRWRPSARHRLRQFMFAQKGLASMFTADFSALQPIKKTRRSGFS